MNISEDLRQKLLAFQKSEITEHHIYRRLARTIGSPQNRRVLEHIAEDERRHYEQWRSYTQQDVPPNRWHMAKYFWISRVLGFTFGVKLMESAEGKIQGDYRRLEDAIRDARAIVQEEEQHEKALLGMLDEERLRYTGSMVVGLNDALVELTGALAGLTLALRDARLIALTGSVTGIAAALSMAASSHLSTKSDDTGKNPLKAAAYTGVAYLLTVLVLILPYLLLSSYFVSLGCTLVGALGIIALFNYHISVARSEPFKSRFFEMAGLSLGVAGFSFLVGLLLRVLVRIDV